MESIRRIFKDNIRQYGMIIALASIIVFFAIFTGGISLRPLNITNLILQNGYILVLAVGMLLVIVTGGIDLSVGSIAAFIGSISAIFMINMHIPVLVTVILSLILGGIVGAWQGFWIAYIKIPAFITTLGGMLIFRGLTMVSLQGMSLAPFPVSFTKISSGFIPDFFNGKNYHITTILIGLLFSIFLVLSELKTRNTQKKFNFTISSPRLMIAKLASIIIVINGFIFTLARYKGLPNLLILLFFLILIYNFITKKTVIGRQVYALGGNEKASELSGIKTNKIKFLVYVNMGIISALSGLVFAARLNAATPKAGTGFELDAIAACFIGGASATGGMGTIIGAIIGGLVMGVMNNGMSLVGLGIDWQQTIKGLVLIFAVWFDVFSKSKKA